VEEWWKRKVVVEEEGRWKRKVKSGGRGR